MRTDKRFDPVTQFEDTIAEIGERMNELRSAFERLEWLRETAAKQFRQMAEAAERVEVFTEAEAAEQLRVSERTIADLRRAELIPFCRFNNQSRYTRQHINEICRILESRPRERARARFDRAA